MLQLPQHNCSTSHTYAPPPTEVNDGTISTTNTNFTNSKPAEQNRLKWAAVPVAAGQHPFKTKVYEAFYPIAPALAVEQTPATRKEKNALK